MPRPILLELLGRLSPFLVLLALTSGLPAGAQVVPVVLPAAQAPAPTSPSPAGSISGTVTDSDGAVVPGAQVSLATDPGGTTPPNATVADSSGRFVFHNVPAGKFKLTIASEGLATTAISIDLPPGEDYDLPQATLAVANVTTDVEVVLTRQQIAEIEVNAEEKQRLGGFLPNFFVAYNWNAPPLDARQKFELAARTTLDPANFLFIGAIAGAQQAGNAFAGYGQGSSGYAKRFAAGYADMAIGTVLGGAILPSLWHQDPRYFYKGTGSKRSRALYALSTAVICKGDNGRWQPNYSSVLGDLAAGAISNLYYPSTDRHGWPLTLENGLLSTVFDGVSNVVQELFLSRITTKAIRSAPSQP